MTERGRQVSQRYSQISGTSPHPPMPASLCPCSCFPLQSVWWTAELNFISYIVPVLSFVTLRFSSPLLLTSYPSLPASLRLSLPLRLLHLSISMRHSSSLHLAQRRLLPLHLSSLTLSRSRSAGYGMYASGCTSVYIHACIWDRLSCILWTVAACAPHSEKFLDPLLALRTCVAFLFSLSLMKFFKGLLCATLQLWSDSDLSCTPAEWNRQI